MDFFKLATSKKSLLGAIGVVGGAVVLDTALDALVPGAGAASSAETSGALATVLPAAGVFIRRLYDKFGELWTNHRVSEHFVAPGNVGRDSALNHDLELQVGRTLAALTERWGKSNGVTIRGALTDLAGRINELDQGRPKWIGVAESIRFEFEQLDLVEAALGNAGRADELGTSWARLLRGLGVELEIAPKVSKHDDVWTRLGAFVAREFAGQFRIDMKRALAAHPEAWAAMQLEIDRLTLDHVLTIERQAKTTHALVDETRRTMLDVGNRCAQRLARINRIGASTLDSVREVRDLLDLAKLELERQRLRPPIELRVVEAADSQLARLHYTARRVRFTGRDAELRRLREFLLSESSPPLAWRKFTWWLWTGPGGMGKSRLALELGLDAEATLGWDAGFFHRESHEKFTTDDWARWRPGRPTLVVFDYAAERSAQIVAAIGALHVRDARAELEHPVRFLLLEREHTSERLVAAMTHDAEGGDANAVSNAAYFGEDRRQWHQELAPLSDASLLDAMVLLFEKKSEPFERDAMLALLQRSDERGRVVPEGNPLFAAVLAETVIEHGFDRVRNDSAAELLRRVLATELRHWKANGVDAAHLNWLVCATILRRPVDLPESWPQGLALLLPAQNAARTDWCDLLSSYGSRSDRGGCTMLPLEPDRFGELLVLDRLAGVREVSLGPSDNPHAAGKAARDLLHAAWSLEAPAVVAFAARTAEDWTRHPHCLAFLELPLASEQLDRRRHALRLLAALFGGFWKWRRLDSAEACARRSLDLARDWCSSAPSPESRRDLSVSMDNVAQIELARGRHDAALKLYSESLELRRALASELGTPESRRDVSVSLNNVAKIELARGRHDAALKLYSESLELSRALASELGTPESEFDLGLSHLFVALASTESNAACEHLRNAHALMRAVIETVGALPRYVQALQFVEQQIAARGCDSGDA